MVDAQTQEASHLLQNKNQKIYPHPYRNKENDERERFGEYERRYDDKRDWVEVPIVNRMDFGRRMARADQVALQDAQLHHRDRARVAKRDLNDPGPFRAIVPVHEDTGRSYGVTGVVYHPEDNPRRLERAAREPMDRQGRQFLRRYEDDCSHGNRVDTWPPRDEDGDELARYESRYKQVRKSIKK